MAGNLDRKLRLPRKYATWDKWLYFPSEGRRAEDFFLALKNPTASAGFEPKGQHATSRPPKPLNKDIESCVINHAAGQWVS